MVEVFNFTYFKKFERLIVAKNKTFTDLESLKES